MMASNMIEEISSSNLQPINEATSNSSRPINTTTNNQNRRNNSNKNNRPNNNNRRNNNRQYQPQQQQFAMPNYDNMGYYESNYGHSNQFPNHLPNIMPMSFESDQFVDQSNYRNQRNNYRNYENRNNNRQRVINQQQPQYNYNNQPESNAQEASQANFPDNRSTNGPNTDQNRNRQQNRPNKTNNRNNRQNRPQVNNNNANNDTTQGSSNVVVENYDNTMPINDNNDSNQNQNQNQQNRSKPNRQRQPNISNSNKNSGSNSKYNRQTSMSSQVSAASSSCRGSKDQNRREILTDQLRKNKYECMICYQYIRNDRPIWSCIVCFHIFHLTCVKKWAQSSTAASTANNPPEKWRCPGCQSPYDQVPVKSTCFCTKKLNPEHQFKEANNSQQQRKNGHQLAHSCGEVCGKLLSLSAPFYSDDLTTSSECECKHKCVLLCHPGPCPACETMVTRACKCGKAKFQVKCSSSRVPLCERPCEKMLACGRHRCATVCHSGDCEPCQVDVEQVCTSHGHTRLVKCGSTEHKASPDGLYQCDSQCGKLLECKNHVCQEKCHSGACKPCALMPSNLTHCPCGKTLTRELLLKNKIIRTSCKDPVPTCDKSCGKLLKCPHNLNDKTTSDFHTCAATCHVGECPGCERDVEIHCRCGKETDTVKCGESESIVKLCDRRCQKKKSCSKHQCTEVCCDDKEHICMQICNKLLACGNHRCEELCHKGACKRCLVASFDERICQCGATIQYPPIRCGTKPLECPNKCTRVHACDHPVSHNCHWEAECPPCSYLTSKMCMGGHEMRHNIPCHMKDVSCGKPCNKPLGTCSHRCIRTCHKGECAQPGVKCTQPCQKPRPHCEHVCGAPCHELDPDPSCPDTICQEVVTVRCKCGLKSKQLKCGQRMYAASQVMFENLACQIKEMLSCKSIDVATFKCQESQKKKHELECDEECLMEERNRNLSQVLLTEASQKPKPIYSEFLKSYAREDPSFAQSVEKKLEALVNESKLAKTGKKSQNLPVMKQTERRFVHELSAYYGIETQSFDSEPYRNVCLYASREKTGLPSISLTQLVDVRPKQSTMPKLRQLNSKLESGIQSQLKVLNPADSGDNIPVSSSFAMLSDEFDETTSRPTNFQAAAATVSEQTNSKNAIDYFDLTD